MRIGIAGARGFVGSYLVRYFREINAGRLRALVRSAGPPAEEECPGVEVVRGDLISAGDCAGFLDGLDVVFYLAHASVPATSDEDLPNDALLNGTPLLNLIQVTRTLGARPHVVYFSSGGAVYGRRAERIPFRESDPCLPCSSYGIQKLMAEHYLRLAAERGILTCTVLRVGNAYGTPLPAHRLQGLIGVAVANVLRGSPVVVFGNPQNVRDYIHLDDLCALCRKAASPVSEFAIFNAGTQKGYSVTAVLDAIERVMGCTVRRQPAANSAHGRWMPDWSVLDIGKARAAWNWTPELDLEAGIRRMVATRLPALHAEGGAFAAGAGAP